MSDENVFDIFDDDDDDIKTVQNNSLDSLRKYQKHHMELLKKHKDEIAFLEKLLSDCRNERKEFFIKELPAISNKLDEYHIDKSIKDEWLKQLERDMRRSFDESDKLISAFAVQKAEEFRESMEEKLKEL